MCCGVRKASAPVENKTLSEAPGEARASPLECCQAEGAAEFDFARRNGGRHGEHLGGDETYDTTMPPFLAGVQYVWCWSQLNRAGTSLLTRATIEAALYD